MISDMTIILMKRIITTSVIQLISSFFYSESILILKNNLYNFIIELIYIAIFIEEFLNFQPVKLISDVSDQMEKYIPL